MEVDVEGRWTHVDLFAGPGGFSVGLEAAGFESLLAIDIHEPSTRTYQRNHPQAKVLLRDIRELTVAEATQHLDGRLVDVVTAGVPCEGFSMANRNRNRFVDERNFLFLEFLRFVEGLKPPYIVLENVSALTRHSNGFFGDEIRSGMEDLGYLVSSRVLDAIEYGVPQRRRRVFFVGRLPGWSFGWPRPTHGSGPGLEPAVTVWQAIGDLPPLDSDEEKTAYGIEPTSAYAREMRGSQRILLNHRAPRHPTETVQMIAATEPGQPMYEHYKQRIRLHPDRPSPTVVSGGIRPQFHYGHPTQPRGMSIRERARIQSFPDSYYFEGGLVQGRVQTGDAVAPLVAAALGHELARGLSLGRADDGAGQMMSGRQLDMFAAT